MFLPPLKGRWFLLIVLLMTNIVIEQQIVLPLNQATINKSLEFKIGDIVEHQIFGKGKIIKLTEIGDDSQVTIKFTTGKPRTFSLKLANLKRS